MNIFEHIKPIANLCFLGWMALLILINYVYGLKNIIEFKIGFYEGLAGAVFTFITLWIEGVIFKNILKKKI